MHQLRISLTNFKQAPLLVEIQSVTPMMTEDGTWRYQKARGNALGESRKIELTPTSTQDVTLPIQLEKLENVGTFYGAYLFETPEETQYVPYTVTGQKLSSLKSFNQLSFKGQVVEEKPGLHLTLQNPNPDVVDVQKIHVKINHKSLFGLKKETWEKDLPEMTFIPNAALPISLHQKGKPLTRGKYEVEVSVVADKEYTIKQPFQLSGKDAKKVNSQATIIQKDYTLPLLVVVFFLVALLFFALNLAVRQQRNIKKRKTKKHS